MQRNSSKAKAHLELNEGSDVKGTKKCFCKHIIGKRKAKENVGPLLNGAGSMVTHDMGKAEMLNIFFSLAFFSKTGLQKSEAPETRV